jgi:DNA polymerase-3 subunit delta
MNIKFNSLFTGINEYIKKKAMVFYGPNIGKIDDCINSVVSLKRKDQKIEIIYRYSDELKSGEIKSVIHQNNSLDLFGNMTVIVLRLFNEKLSKEIIESLNGIQNNGLKIIIRAEQLGVKSILRKYFEKTEDLLIVPCYEESAFEKKKYVEDFFRRERISVTESFITTLSNHLSNDRLEIREELNKIQLLTEGEDLNIENLNIFYDSVYSDEIEFINSLVSGKVDSYLSKQFDRLTQLRSEQIRCTSILLEHFYKLFKVKFLLSEGVSNQEAQSTLKPPIFFKYKNDFEKQLSIWSLRNLEMIIKKLILCKKKFFKGDASASAYFFGCLIKIIKIKVKLS